MVNILINRAVLYGITSFGERDCGRVGKYQKEFAFCIDYSQGENMFKKCSYRHLSHYSFHKRKIEIL